MQVPLVLVLGGEGHHAGIIYSVIWTIHISIVLVVWIVHAVKDWGREKYPAWSNLSSSLWYCQCLQGIMPGFPGVFPKETNFCSRGNQRRQHLVPVGHMSWEMHHNYLMKSNISGVALFMSIFYASLGIKIRFIEMHLTRYCNRNSKLVIIFRSTFFLNRTTYPPPLQACCIIHHCCIMEFSEKNDTAYAALYILPFWNALIKVVIAKPLTLSIRYMFSRIRCSLRSI